MNDDHGCIESGRLNINNRDPRGYDRGRDMGPRVNERIRVREILVIDETGAKLGAWRRVMRWKWRAAEVWIL